ncbi:MAG TPA: D-arabinono-1,4-lactone oxidase [Dinghuibacter sp.]|jgi:xylitol oxidase|uniref:D-arabinono-1,4-lactone oxidase n=1 Tax=Dinghuibacter sp. TaxID=2024697 RepID=UPI002BF45B14|nr:D-arabinono-1,4-lactone oxidase [Dinghuibacter sp.]HTJ14115.1 D-arabinono-1,4-lactone oxidase [Dinghuibacter sp.]
MDQTIQNWSGNLIYGSTDLESPGSTDEAAAWIRGRRRFKVLGSRHCFNDIADSKDALLSLASMDRMVSLDETARTVTVEAGVTYGVLAVFLEDRGYALHNLASLPHISVAGGCATATHGSGLRNTNLSAAVVGMEFLTTAGDQVGLSGEELQAAAVHLGGLGVVTRLTLRIEPTYQVRQYVYENLRMDVLERNFETIMGSAYSVSLFTDWTKGNIGEVWLKCRDPFAAPPEFFGAMAATRDLNPVKDMPAENCTPQMGVPGPWHERLPHFRMGFMPSSGKELQSEYLLPLEYAYRAIRAVETLHARVSPHLIVSEIRCVAADDLWMSTAQGRNSVAIHFTWKQEAEAVRRLLPVIETALAPFHARPHWGKLFAMERPQLERLYPRIGMFREVLRQYDPEEKLRNAFLERCLYA